MAATAAPTSKKECLKRFRAPSIQRRVPNDEKGSLHIYFST
nr:MAG TPA: hypothetical protein [Caudoviricetes sp.]